jgi:hypothetical protein
MRFHLYRALLLATVATPLALFSQTLGTITGEVKDGTGASVAGAAITVRNTGTNGIRNVLTNEEGVYNVPAVSVSSIRTRARTPSST